MINIKTYAVQPKDEYPEEIKSSTVPEFVTYREDINKLKKELEPYQKYSKIIVIGNGGSITTFGIYVRALKGNGKKVFLLNTNEPDLIANLKKEFQPIDTIIVCISKSGSNVSPIEALLQFQDYSAIVVTGSEDTPLAIIAKHFKWTIINHPSIGGRFSGFTSSAFVPAELFGLPLDRIQKGAKEMYQQCSAKTEPTKNPAWQIASVMYQMQLVGKDEIFLPLYSYYLETAIPLIMQLVHETLGKKGKGFSVIGAVAPESQHHTNQRFFGGKKNMVGIFITVKNQRDQSSKTEIPEELMNVALRDGTLSDLNNIKLADALSFEFEGTKQDAREKKIPIIHIDLETIDSYHIASLIALWQMIVYYLAILLGVDPFDQPEVEISKEISYELRSKING